MELKTKNGTVVPPVGLGTYPLQGEQLADIIYEAYKVGYRLIDTSDDYRGETGVGMAIERLKAEGVDRENLFIQTKISTDNAYADEPLRGIYFNKNNDFMKRHTVEEVVREKVEISLREMKTDYLDSLLIHYPFYGYYEEIWGEFCKLKKEGVVRYIGVSNFTNRHIDKLIADGLECPAINEIYVSPLGTKQDRIDYANGRRVQIMTYSPLHLGNMSEDDLKSMMEKYGKTMQQIVLRWNIQRGCMPLPKTRNVQRLKENFNVFDFELTQDEMKCIDALNEDYQYLVESQICPGI